MSFQIDPKWNAQFIRVRCLRSYPLPLYLDLGSDIGLDSIVDVPNLLDRCTGIHIRSPDQWRIVGSHLPRLKSLVLSCRIPEGNWKAIPTLQCLTLERLGGIGDIWAVPLLENIVQLEAIYSSKLWHEMQSAATFARKVQVLCLSMVEFTYSRAVLERYFFRLTPPYAVRERTFNQLTHLVRRYTNTSPVRHPLPFVGVPCLIHLEILLYHLRNVIGILTFDYPTVTRLTVTMFANSSPAVIDNADDPADMQGLLDLITRFPNLKTADLTVTSPIMVGLRAELGRNPTPFPPLSKIRHCLPTP